MKYSNARFIVFILNFLVAWTFTCCDNSSDTRKSSKNITGTGTNTDPYPSNNPTNTPAPTNTQGPSGSNLQTLTSSGFPKLMHTASQISIVKQQLNNGFTNAAYVRLQTQANSALNLIPNVPTDYNVPGYYQDKEGHRAAKKPLDETGDAAYSLALLYHFTGDFKYATKAAELVTTWGTKNKSISGTDGRLTMMYLGIHLLLAADLIMDYQGWSVTDKQTFLAWLSNVFVPATQSIRSADATKDHRFTNWGAWSYLGAVSAASLLNNKQMLAQETENIKLYISNAIASNGELPEENKRKKSGMWYTYFALAPITAAIYVIKNNGGEDLFKYQSPNGRSVKLALDKLFTYCLNPNSWPYMSGGFIDDLLNPSSSELEVPKPNDWPGNLYEAMSKIYGEGSWENWIQSARPITGDSAWIYPTLVRSGL